MRNLLNFIFANLIPIVVVVSIVLRIIGGMRNQARKKQQPRTTLQGPGEGQRDEEEYLDVWDRLKPDEEGLPTSPAYGKAPGASYDAGGVYPPVRDIRPLLMPRAGTGLGAPAPRPVPSLVVSPAPPPAPPPFTPASPLFEPEAVTEPEIGLGSPGKKPAVAFFQRLEKLPPLRRAVILAEILSPPRGLSHFPAE